MNVGAVKGRPGHRVYWQPGRWPFWGYLALVVTGAYVLLGGLLGAIGLLSWWTGPCLIGVLGAVSLVLLLLLRAMVVFWSTPAPLLIAAAGWGMFAATGVAGEVNKHLLRVFHQIFGFKTAAAWGPAFLGPSDEEWLKAVGVVAVVLLGRRFVVRPIQGLVLGAWCGLGFQLVEDAGYAIHGAFTDPVSDTAGFMHTLLFRTAGAISSHWMLTAISGLGVGYAMTRREYPLPRRLGFAFGMFALAWSLHFLWNSPLLYELGTPMNGEVIGVALRILVIAFVFLVVWWFAIRSEWRWFASVMRAEPDWVITSAEMASLRTGRRRRSARKRLRRVLARRLQRAQLNLPTAMIVEPSEGFWRREEIFALRMQLAASRDGELPRRPNTAPDTWETVVLHRDEPPTSAGANHSC